MEMSGIILLIVCLIMSLCVALFLGSYIDLLRWKRIAIIAVAYVFCIAGLLTVNRIENGLWNGISYYGAHFFGPVGVLLMCFLLRVPAVETFDMLDISAVMLSFSIVIIKINCAIVGCCAGRVLWTAADGHYVIFPSQIAECLAALLIALYLIYCILRHRHRGMIMPIFYIVYGIVRFYLHLLRATKPWIGIFPAGNFWSMISVAIGGFCFFVHYLRTINRKNVQVAHTHSRR